MKLELLNFFEDKRIYTSKQAKELAWMFYIAGIISTLAFFGFISMFK